jgi:Ca2+:H+ antiporter
MPLLYAMLIFIPLSIFLKVFHAPAGWIFISSALAIVPLAGIMGTATEELSKRLGSASGGFLNATFGNATELIITILAIHAGELDVVRASIIGSIIGNILLVLGLSMFLGGLKYKIQTFSQDIAGLHTVMLILAVIAILTPSLFVKSYSGKETLSFLSRINHMSLWIAAFMVLIYLGSLWFSMKTHQDIYRGGEEEEWEPPAWSKSAALIVLGLSALLVALESDLLVMSITPTVNAWKINKLFVGIILIPIIGNAAEHATAVKMALKNKMDVTLNICVSSSTQIAFFLAPIAVFFSFPLGHPFPFIFTSPELVAVGFSAVIAAFIARDGQCNWLEGAQLLMVYAIFAVAFFFVS